MSSSVSAGEGLSTVRSAEEVSSGSDVSELQDAANKRVAEHPMASTNNRNDFRMVTYPSFQDRVGDFDKILYHGVEFFVKYEPLVPAFYGVFSDFFAKICDISPRWAD